jgi:hypothetical protein
MLKLTAVTCVFEKLVTINDIIKLTAVLYSEDIKNSDTNHHPTVVQFLLEPCFKA